MERVGKMHAMLPRLGFSIAINAQMMQKLAMESRGATMSEIAQHRGHQDGGSHTGVPPPKNIPTAKAEPIPAPGRPSRAAAVIVTAALAAIIGSSLWYLVQPQPLLVQGEADARRIDIAARVDGRVGQRPVERGDNVVAGQLLVAIDNPELLTRLQEVIGLT